MVRLDSKKLEDLLKLAIALVALLLVNNLASRYFFRVDFTEEQRFSIKNATKNMLKELDDDVYVEVFLAGDLNADFKRLQQGIKEVLEEFEVYSNKKVKFSFSDPLLSMDQKAQNEFISSLSLLGITPTQVYDNEDGKKTQKLILPGAIISYGEGEKGVMLLKGNMASSAREKINQSIEGVEFEIASAIAQLTNVEQKKIALLKGHGELDSLQIAGLRAALLNHYHVSNLVINREFVSPQEYDAVIVAKPTKPFSEQDKYYLDQYIMNGGKVLFLIDQLEVNMDSIASDANFAFPYQLKLDDMFFKYGVRINADLVQDLLATRYPIVVGNVGDQSQIQMMSWPFFPLISKYSDHFAVKNLDAIAAKFVSTMDTVKAAGVVKTPMLFTSEYSRNIAAPVKVSINDLRRELTREKFNKQHLAIGYLLEGNFTSLYNNRFLPEGVANKDNLTHSVPTKVMIVSDGDIARNEINPTSGEPMELGYDPYARITFANQDFLINSISYLVDGEGLIAARAKEVKIRPLDAIKVKDERLFWQIINLVLPITLLFIFGGVKYVVRKRKYAKL